MPDERVGWDLAFDAVIATRRHLAEQQAVDKRVNKRRDQIDKRLYDIEMAIAWLTVMAKEEKEQS